MSEEMFFSSMPRCGLCCQYINIMLELMCWHHQSVWPKLHRHSNITSNHCSSFQTTLNSPCGLYGLIWASGAWLGPWEPCAVWRAHTPQPSAVTTPASLSEKRRKVGFRHVAIMRCADNAVSLPCLLTIWPLWPGPVIMGDTRDNHSPLSLASGHTTTTWAAHPARYLRYPTHSSGWEVWTHFICLVNNIILIYWGLETDL